MVPCLPRSRRLRCSRAGEPGAGGGPPADLGTTSQGTARRGGGEATLGRRDASASAPGGGRSAAGDRWVGRGDRGRANRDGQQGTRRDPQSLDGERLRFCCEARSLPGLGGTPREGAGGIETLFTQWRRRWILRSTP